MVDLSKNQAIGVWVKGDGNGQIFNIGLRSPVHLNGGRSDHFIKIDFIGWKYFELVETDSEEFSNYLWPDHHLYVYRTYRHLLYYNDIERLQLWFNNLPVNKEVNCLIGPIKALPLAQAIYNDLTIIVGKEEINFPVTIKSGEYIEFKSIDDCKLFNSNGEVISNIPIQKDMPLLKKGYNEISFKCNNISNCNSRFLITVISEGEPL